ncbi:hypothetical protein GCM10009767_36110 [Kocuria aegyptia]|uniref:Uncharacterized protein n=1 Tax=Kocuria aegyptia TaxID=330943 RepID=A0ABN2L5L6_9MICC
MKPIVRVATGNAVPYLDCALNHISYPIPYRILELCPAGAGCDRVVELWGALRRGGAGGISGQVL